MSEFVAEYDLTSPNGTDDSKCDWCSKNPISSGGLICDGGCKRRIGYPLERISHDFSVERDDDCTIWVSEPALFCDDCVKEFIETSEGYLVCPDCADELKQCEKCDKPILDEFGCVKGKLVALDNKCNKCLIKEKETGK